MMITRLSKTALVATIALLSTLVAFGNITDYDTNFAFVQHVLSMDTVFPDSKITYRAFTNPALHHIAYSLIITAETLTAVLCWLGVFRMLGHVKRGGVSFNESKALAIVGLTLGFLVWQVGFVSIGGEWFGMWMSESWNGVPSAFRFFITIIAVLIFISLPDQDLRNR